MSLDRRSFLAAAASAPVLMTVAQAEAQGIKPKRGGTLFTMITPEPPILQIGVNNQGPTLVAAPKIFQGLLKFSPKLEPLPELAKSWTVSPDGLEYIFKLQENVKWHDGQPFTADDVVFSAMQFNMQVAPRLRAILEGVKECVAVDPHTVRFTLKQAFEPFLLCFDVTAMPMVAKHLFEGHDFRNAPTVQKPIGTGPFKFTEWKRGDYIQLDRFEDYWKPGQPYLDKIIFRVIPDAQSRRISMESGQSQLAAASDLEPLDVSQMKANPKFNIRTDGWEYFSPLAWIEINNRVKPMDDARVRRAMSHALNRDFIVKNLWFGFGKPATSPIASGTRFHDPSVKLPAYDLAAAKKLLDECGLKPDANGVRFRINHLVSPYSEIWTRLGEYFKQSMSKVGIAVDLVAMDPGSVAPRLSNWDFDTTTNFLYQYGDPTLGVERSYVSSNIKKVIFTNIAGYSNPVVDDLFAKARLAQDPAERQKYFSEVQKVLVHDMPELWFMEMTFPTVYDKKLHDVIELATGPNSSLDDAFFA